MYCLEQVVGTPEDYEFVTKSSGLPWAEVVSVVGAIANGKNMGIASGMAAQQYVTKNCTYLNGANIATFVIFPNFYLSRLFRNGTWTDRYKYMYWTESDQVLIMRDPEPLFRLIEDGEHIIVPHRLLPFPRSEDFAEKFSNDANLNEALKGALKKEFDSNDEKPIYDIIEPPRQLVGTAIAETAPMRAALEGASCCFDAGDCTRRDHWRHFSTRNVYMMRFSPNMGVVNGEANIFHNTWRTCKFSPSKQICDSKQLAPGRSATD